MKPRLTKLLVALSAILGAVATLDVTAVIALPLHPDVTKTIALVPVISAALLHTFKPLIDRYIKNNEDQL